MDAKITKQRLGNQLSYDWLKIVVVIGVAVLALILLFTIIATSPAEAQVFTVYGYDDLVTGSGEDSLADDMKEKNVFSYDILKINVESFYGNSYASAAYSARRAAGEGTVMFVSALDGDGEYTTDGNVYSLVGGGEYLYRGGDSTGFYDPQYFLETELYAYLQRFFGEELNGELNEAEAEACFTARNGSDKRFRTAAKKAEGIESEKQRLVQLRDDYFAVKEAFESGLLRYALFDAESGAYSSLGWGETCGEGSFVPSIRMDGLGKISQLFYYKNADGAVTTESVNLMLFYNIRGSRYDLCYETVSFLRYLTAYYAT